MLLTLLVVSMKSHPTHVLRVTHICCAHPSHLSPSPKLGPQSSSRAPGTARQTSLREQEGPGPGEGGTGGGQGTQRLSSMNSVARRAQVAEARYAALQREHAAVLGKLEELQQVGDV